MTTTFTKTKTLRGSQTIAWNVDRNGRPFGQITTFKAKPGYVWGFTAIALNGAHAHFDTLPEAQAWMEAA